MSLHKVPLFSFDFLPSRPVRIEVCPAPSPATRAS